jgi:CRP/FNR family transcriptional regulator, cyclic AMP receptor protein
MPQVFSIIVLHSHVQAGFMDSTILLSTPHSLRNNHNTVSPTPAVLGRALTELPSLLESVVQLLRTSSALTPLSDLEARCIASYMRLMTYPTHATLIQEGDEENTGFMLLILHGEVSVEIHLPDINENTVISVLGPGHFIGEMALLDGAPRAASCIATNPIQAALLTRRALDLMMNKHPLTAIKFMTSIAQRLSERLRATDEQLRMYGLIVTQQQNEIKKLQSKSHLPQPLVCS